jgi:hypothetical protein
VPTITKLNPDAVATLQGVSERQRIAARYDALLADFAANEWGDVLLEDGDDRAVVSRRLKAAAARRGLALRFRQRRDDRLRFQLIAPPKRAPAPPQAAPQERTPPAVSELPPLQPRTQREPTPSPKSRKAKATERYQDVLPRWMREGGVPPRPPRPRRRTR